MKSNPNATCGKVHDDSLPCPFCDVTGKYWRCRKRCPEATERECADAQLNTTQYSTYPYVEHDGWCGEHPDFFLPEQEEAPHGAMPGTHVRPAASEQDPRTDPTSKGELCESMFHDRYGGYAGEPNLGPEERLYTHSDLQRSWNAAWDASPGHHATIECKEAVLGETEPDARCAKCGLPNILTRAAERKEE